MDQHTPCQSENRTDLSYHALNRHIFRAAVSNMPTPNVAATHRKLLVHGVIVALQTASDTPNATTAEQPTGSISMLP